MAMQRFFSLPIGLLALAAPAAGEPLDLVAAMARARAQAHEVGAARGRGEAADARLRQARGGRLPTVRLSESWIRTDAPADVFGLQLAQERFSFGDFVTGDPNDPDPLDTAISRVELELPLWTGGEISARIEQAERGLASAERSAERAADAAAVAAGQAWLDLARAREALALLERSRSTVAGHAARARDLVAQGMLVRSELLRAEVELARIDDLLAEARRGVEVAQSNLAFRLAEPQDAAYELPALAAPAATLTPLDAWLAASAERADLVATRERLSAGELEAKAIRAGLWPRVGLVARHDWTDDELFGDNGSASSVIAAATFDLFDGGRRRAAAAAAAAEADSGRWQVEQFAAGVTLEVRAAHAAAAAALERQRTAGAALAAAEEGLRIVEERFAAGLLRTVDVLDAATARREAEMRELVARADAHAALLRLALAAGEPPEAAVASSATPGVTSR